MMKNIRELLPLDPDDSEIDIDYISIDFHEGTGTTITDSAGTLNDGTVTGTDTADGTLWAASRYGISPDQAPTADTAIQFNNKGEDDFFRLTNFNGRLLCSVWFYFSGDLTADEFLFTAGPPFTSGTEQNGALGMKITSGEVMAAFVKGPGNTTTGAAETLSLTAAMTSGTLYHFLVSWDFATATQPVIEMYMNGDLNSGAKTITGGNVAGGRPAPGTLALFHRYSAAGGATPSGYLNSSGGTGHSVRKLQFFKAPSGRFSSSDVAVLAKRFYALKGALPRELLG